MTARRYHVALACASLLAGFACATGSVQVSPEARAVSALKHANTAYEETLIATGAYCATRPDPDACSDPIEAAAQPVYQALVTARGSLILYLSVRSDDPTELTAAINDVSDALGKLLATAERQGVQ